MGILIGPFPEPMNQEAVASPLMFLARYYAGSEYRMACANPLPVFGKATVEYIAQIGRWNGNGMAVTKRARRGCSVKSGFSCKSESV